MKIKGKKWGRGTIVLFFSCKIPEDEKAHQLNKIFRTSFCVEMVKKGNDCLLKVKCLERMSLPVGQVYFRKSFHVPLALSSPRNHILSKGSTVGIISGASFLQIRKSFKVLKVHLAYKFTAKNFKTTFSIQKLQKLLRKEISEEGKCRKIMLRYCMID